MCVCVCVCVWPTGRRGPIDSQPRGLSFYTNVQHVWAVSTILYLCLWSIGGAVLDLDFSIDQLNIQFRVPITLNVNPNPQSYYCKAWYSSEVQATFCCAVRGDTYSPSPHFDPQPHNYHANRHHQCRRFAPMGFQEIMTSLQNGSCAPESVTHARIRFHRRKHKVVHQHAQIRFPSHLRILFLMALISMSPNSDSGEHNAHPKPRPYPSPSSASPNGSHSLQVTHTRACARTQTQTCTYVHNHLSVLAKIQRAAQKRRSGVSQTVPKILL